MIGKMIYKVIYTMIGKMINKMINKMIGGSKKDPAKQGLNSGGALIQK